MIPRQLVAMAAALFLVGAAGGAAAGEAAPAPAAGPAEPGAAPEDADLAGHRIAEVRVEGLETVPADRVVQVMLMRVGRPFDPAAYRGDFNRIHALGFFANVELLAPEVVPDGLLLRVVCLEHPLVSAVVVKGNLEISTRKLLDRARADGVALEAGSRGGSYAVFRMRNAFLALYAEKRYALATVETLVEKDPAKPGRVKVTFTVNEDRPVDVRSVEFAGRAALKEEQLVDVIKTKPPRWWRGSQPFDPDTLLRDARNIQELYRNSGYSDARVEPGDAKMSGPAGWWKHRAATAVFTIAEGSFYRLGPVSFRGLTLASEAEARKRIELVSGRPYSEGEVREAVEKIEGLLGEHGRPFARVVARRKATAEPRVDAVEFQIVEGPPAVVGEIRTWGNTRTRDRVILREFQLLPGKAYDSRKVAACESSLRRLGLFAKVTTRPIEGASAEVADLEVEVEETRTGSFLIGAGVSMEDGSIGGSVSVSERNFDWRRVPGSGQDLPRGSLFRGGGQRASAEVSVTETSRAASLNFDNPWIWDTPEHYSFGFSLFYSDRELPEFEDRRMGTAIRMGRNVFFPEVHGEVQYKIQQATIHGIGEDEPLDIRRDEGTTLYSSVRLGLTLDTRDAVPVTSSGWLAEISEETFGGPFGGDRDFFKVGAEGNRYFTLFHTYDRPHVIQLRVRADWAKPYGRHDFVPVNERFYAGGIDTVRGFDYGTISPRVDGKVVGGDFRLIENVEYTFPLYRDLLRGAIFFDAGDVWPEAEDFELHDQRRSVGVGLHIKPPEFLGSAPIRLYFCKALNPRDDEDRQLIQFGFNFSF